jgi:hypothetical protein
VPRHAPTSLLGLTFSVLLAPLLVLAPTVTRPLAAHPHPVGPRLAHLSVAGVDASALAHLGAAHRPLALTAERSTSDFSLVGVTWDNRDATAPVDVQVRTRTAGTWTSWHDLDGLDDVEADPGSQDAKAEQERAGTAPYWVGPSDGVQVRVDGKRMPRGMRVELIDPGTSDADATAGQRTVPASSADAAVSQPSVVSRAGWGADESLRSGTPDYAPPIKVAFVHHTDTTNSYSPSQSASIVRSIYAYHTKSRGWSDIGYNFLIDKYGTIFEGRYGGIDKAVIGAHTGGFNSHSFAASLMGNYATAQPSSAMMSSLEKLFAWKMQMSYLSPYGTGTLVSSGGGTSRYSAGTSHTFNAISGHRDAGYTTCPGGYVYSKLGTVRAAVRSIMGPSFVLPSASPASRGLLDAGGFTVSAGAVNDMRWYLTVTDATTGVLVRKTTGTATPSAKVAAVWDRLDDKAVPAPPGRYVLRLDGVSSDGRTARSWATTVTITSPVTLEAPAQGAWNSQVPLKGGTKPGATVQLELMPKGSTSWIPAGSVTADSVGKFTGTFLLTDDTDVRATTSGYPSEVKRVKVAPIFTTSTPTELGSTLTMSGTARPGSAVDVAFQRPNGTSWNGRHATADLVTGGWTVELPMSSDWTLVATADGVSTPARTVWITPTLDPSDLTIGTLNSAVSLSGTGSPSGVVDLQTRPVSGSTTWSTVGHATPDGTGLWSGTVPLTNDLDIRAIAHGLSSTVTRTTRVRPAASAPSSSPWNSTVALRGTARPGASVTVSRTVGGTTTNVITTASTAGAWAAPFTLTDATSWSATAGGLGSNTGTTRVQPTLAAPGVGVVGRTIQVSGTARPGSSVVLAIRQAGAAVGTPRPAVTADSLGQWKTTVTPTALGTAPLTATADSVTSVARGLPVVAGIVRAVGSSALGATVLVKGVARPSSSVRVELKAGSAATWSGLRWVKADSTGLWSTTYPLRNDTWVRGVTADGASAGALTKVGPTLLAPSSAKLGTTISLRGTARPGTAVSVYIRYSSESTAVLRRATKSNSYGGWGVSWPFQRWIAVYVVSNGIRSVTRVTTAQ